MSSFDDGSELRFVDPRTFGEWFVSSDIDGRGVPAELEHIGRDPLLEGLPAAYMPSIWRAAAPRSRPCSPISGSSPASGASTRTRSSFRSKLRPDRPGGSLTPAELGSLAKAARSVLREAVKSRGSSLRDQRYRDVAGGLGSYQGAPCRLRPGRRAVPALRRARRRLKIGASSAYFCKGVPALSRTRNEAGDPAAIRRPRIT